MSASTYPLLPICSAIGIVASVIPLSWHLQAWNSGTCFFMMWSALGCLNVLVNTVVWHGNAFDSAPAWCEISTRITLGASVGIPAASLCINRRLYHIAKVHAVLLTHAEKIRAILIDTVVCVVVPLICVILSYIVQGHRYNIFEDLGCQPAIFNTVPAYFLVYMWPIVIGLVSAVYCCLSLRALIYRQAQFNQFLSSGTSLTASRYFRLMALALTDLLLSVPFGIYEIYSNIHDQAVSPWKGWADAHFNFGRVDQYPAGEWRASPALAVPLELSRWIVPTCAFIFFAYFGFAEEARRHYRSAFRVVLAKLRGLFTMLPTMRKEIPKGAAHLSSADWLPSYSAPDHGTLASSSIAKSSFDTSSPTLYELAAREKSMKSAATDTFSSFSACDTI